MNGCFQDKHYLTLWYHLLSFIFRFAFLPFSPAPPPAFFTRKMEDGIETGNRGAQFFPNCYVESKLDQHPREMLHLALITSRL